MWTGWRESFLICYLFFLLFVMWRDSIVNPVKQKAEDKRGQSLYIYLPGSSHSQVPATANEKRREEEVRWDEKRGEEHKDRDLSIPDRELWIEVIHSTVKIKTSSVKKKNQKISTNTYGLCFSFILSLPTPPYFSPFFCFFFLHYFSISLSPSRFLL